MRDTWYTARGGRGKSSGGQGGVKSSRLVGDTVGRGGNDGGVRRGNITRGGLGVGHGDTVGDIDTGGSLEICVTNFEKATWSVAGHVVRAAHTVVNVLAVGALVTCGGGRVTNRDAEGVATHEVGPVNDLLVTVIVATVAGEGVGVHQTTKGVPTQVSAVRVELSSVVISSHVDLDLVEVTSDLDVSAGLQELDTLESTLGDETSAVAGLGAPGNLLLLRVTNGGVGQRRSPKTEIVDVVDHGSLAHGILVFGGGVADVVADLRTTDGCGVVVNLVGDSRRVSIGLVDKWGRVSGIGLSESKL